jgi:ubiquinone/menaquinone biosynthesis C-methylase UbiE
MNKVISEKNIKVFNQDIKESGSYIYARKQIYSAKLATGRQTEEIVKTIKNIDKKQIKIIDVGCGDGTFTIELFKEVKPDLILGFDPAGEAVKRAKRRIKNTSRNKIIFTKCSIYQINKMIRSHTFDIAVIRGVLHHLDNPEKAIAEISKYFPKIIILEPNGLNLMLKIIEKISKYHLDHQEKSFRPATVSKWFSKYNYRLSKQRYLVLVPYFCNPKLGKILKFIEPFIEAIPLIRNLLCGSVISLYEKKYN